MRSGDDQQLLDDDVLDLKKERVDHRDFPVTMLDSTWSEIFGVRLVLIQICPLTMKLRQYFCSTIPLKRQITWDKVDVSLDKVNIKNIMIGGKREATALDTYVMRPSEVARMLYYAHSLRRVP